MKVTLDFDSEEIALFAIDIATREGILAERRIAKSRDAFLALWEVSQEIFRPARKHGYRDEPQLNELLDGEHGGAVAEAVAILERKYSQILAEKNIDLDGDL